MEIGRDSVVIGNVHENLRVGDRCVIIGSTDTNDNTILNGTMAIGHEAKAGPQSSAIGTRAGAGLNTNIEPSSKKLFIKIFEMVERFVKLCSKFSSLLKGGYSLIVSLISCVKNIG